MAIICTILRAYLVLQGALVTLGAGSAFALLYSKLRIALVLAAGLQTGKQISSPKFELRTIRARDHDLGGKYELHCFQGRARGLQHACSGKK